MPDNIPAFKSVIILIFRIFNSLITQIIIFLMFMKHPRLILIFLLLSGITKSQDSTKTINQEIGFNTVLLIKQLFSNNPSSTLSQLPYSVFYNIYFKDQIGIRVGLGLNNYKTKSSVEGQNTPRETTQKNTALRIGVSYNFVKYNRLTLNAFGDGIYQNNSFNTVDTQTLTNGPVNTTSITTLSSDKTTGIGAQVGVGIKYTIYKHLSAYIEVPITFVAQTTNSDVTTTRTNYPVVKNTTKSTYNSTSIFLPTTLYLVLRF